MTPKELRALDRELTSFSEYLLTGMGRPERRAALSLYITGLLLDGERKSIEPIAGRLVDHERDVQSMRQRLQQAVVVARWDASEMFGRIAHKLARELPKLRAFVLDDTGFPKKGRFSVGVARQYSGTLGRVDNCQVATSLHLAGEHGSGCIGLRLYLPKEWADDRKRCAEAGIPDDVKFEEKWRIGLQLLDEALSLGLSKQVVLADAGYGNTTEFREALKERGLDYLVAVSGNLTVWSPDSVLQVPARRAGTGRPPTRLRVERGGTKAIADLATELRYRKVTWREGSKGLQASRFAAVRIRTAHRSAFGQPPGPEEWLLCEWPPDTQAPAKFYLSSLPPDTSLRELVRYAKLRWRIERDYQEMKGELGLDHFEGRTWNGFHHHAALCAAAHAFLALRRAISPPKLRKLDSAFRSTTTSAGPAT